MTELLAEYGSFRRLCDAYWKGEMAKERERQLEEAIPKDLLWKFRPIDGLRPKTESITIAPNGNY